VRRRERTGSLLRSSAARIFLATLFSLALLSGVAPAGPLSAGHFCSMPCCAGKAPHAAGSCAGGSCHARVAVQRKAAPEKFCGLRPERFARLRTDRSANSDYRATRKAADAPNANSTGIGGRDAATKDARVAPAALTHTCPPDCGACASAPAQLRRPHDAAALSEAGRARPPTHSSLSPHAQTFTPALPPQRERSNPRAPPSLS
jgi:hypothetical protein